MNAHSSTHYTGLFLHIVLDQPLASIKRCYMAFACLHISNIVFFCEPSVILLSQIEQTYGKAIVTVFGSCRPVLDLEQNCILNGLHAPWPQANLYFVNPFFRLPVRPQPPKGLLLQKRKMLIPSVRINCCLRAHLGQILLRTFG